MWCSAAQGALLCCSSDVHLSNNHHDYTHKLILVHSPYKHTLAIKPWAIHPSMNEWKLSTRFEHRRPYVQCAPLRKCNMERRNVRRAECSRVNKYNSCSFLLNTFSVLVFSLIVCMFGYISEISLRYFHSLFLNAPREKLECYCRISADIHVSLDLIKILHFLLIFLAVAIKWTS